jgi:hypothetical protein
VKGEPGVVADRPHEVVATGGRQPVRNQVLTTRVGLQLPATLTFEQWAETGPKLVRIVDAFAWCIGDWLIYGQERYADRYAKAVRDLSLDYQTLRNYAWVARKFETSRRREGLSFQHHAEVASLRPTDQDEWLDRAEKHRWSKSQLRRELKEVRSSGQQVDHAGTALPRLPVEPDRLESWRVAATHAGTDLASWVVATLDREAMRTLGR